MKRFNIEKLNEKEMKELIAKFIKESHELMIKERYDNSAKLLIAAGKLMKQIPRLKRKELRENVIKKKIDKQIKNWHDSETGFDDPGIDDNNPFGQ